MKIKFQKKENSFRILGFRTKLIIIGIIFLIKIGEFNKTKNNNKNKKIIFTPTPPPKKLKIGIIGEHHSQNIGNNLLKYAMFIKLKELGFEPQIIGYLFPGNNISTLKKVINVRIINKSFKEINRNDYDILMVNSDQVWRYRNLFNFDIGFLKFSQGWNITKFIYGASLGANIWKYKSNEDIILKKLINEFTGVSVREKGTIELVKNHLNITPTLVIDPTFLIDKKYYLDLIKDYKNGFNSTDNYLFVYSLSKMFQMKNFIRQSLIKLKYKLYKCRTHDKDYIERFIYGIYNCKAVITNSYHGILFSIIFRKPFVAFNSKHRGADRFDTLKNVYGIKKRIVSKENPPNISLLTEPFDVDMKIFDKLRIKSINYLKKNLGIENNN